VAVVLAAPALVAAPLVRSAALRFGASPRLPAGEWVYLDYVLDNPDPQEVTVRISLRAAEHSHSVYEKTVTLAPCCTLGGREPVVADPSEEYVLSLFLGDERIQRETAVVSSAEAITNPTLMFLNDSPDFAAAGEFLNPSLLREAVSCTSVSARLAPSHWSAYGHVRVVVVALPRYRDLSAVQFAALANYVEHGGAVLFACPEGTLAAASTPWAALLPVVPLRVRRTEALSELDAWGEEMAAVRPASDGKARVPLMDRDGFPILESSPCGDGVTVLASDAGPLIRWRRCGLGRVGVVATDPCDDRISRSAVFVPFWNHVLCYTQPVFALRNLENSQTLPTVLSHLTGFTIPGVGAVGGVLYGYVACLLAVLVGGFLWRRHVASWLVAAGLGLLLTGLIFAWASRQNASRSGSRAALLDLRLCGDRRTSGHTIVSLFSTRDLRPDITAVSGACRLRPLPSPARGKRREPLDAPLIVRRQGDLSGLSAIAVQALKPREFAVEYDGPLQDVVPAQLTLGERGPALTAPSQVPPGAAAFLLTGDDLIPLDQESLRGGPLGGGGSLLAADPFITDLRHYLTRGAFPRPSLVTVQRWREAVRPRLAVLTPGFVEDGYAVCWMPVATAVSPGPVHISPEMLRLETARAGSRLLAYLSTVQESMVLRAPQTVLAYDVCLPPVLGELRPERVTVDLDLANAGGNIEAAVRVMRAPAHLGAPGPEAEVADLWARAIPAGRSEDGQFRFEGPAVASLIRPAYGRFRLYVQLSQKQVVISGQDAERANRWRVNRLRVALDGVLPPGDETRKL